MGEKMSRMENSSALIYLPLIAKCMRTYRSVIVFLALPRVAGPAPSFAGI